MVGKGMERLSQSLFDASVDLNPHQREAAAFALSNPVSLRKRWVAELEEKFHLPTRILETGAYRRMRKEGSAKPFDTERRAITRPFYPSDEEQRLYDELNNYLQREDTYASPSRHRHLSVLIVRKLLASSSAALVGTLEMLQKRSFLPNRGARKRI